VDQTEKLVASFLDRRGYTDVKYEPDGNIPPDFLVDGRIAIEVRRLNQQYESNGTVQGLEEVAIPLWQRIKALASSFGPPRQEVSWYLDFRFRRPVENWKTLEPKLRIILDNFLNGSTHERSEFSLGKGFEIEIFQAGTPRANFYVMAAHSDRDAGGWVLAEIQKNLQKCINEKTAKIAKVREKYAEWWLVLADYIGFGLDDFDRRQFSQNVSLAHNWDKIILVHPTDPTHAFEI
jgi:hypothetical protein